jgi:hypothetical protein
MKNLKLIIIKNKWYLYIISAAFLIIIFRSILKNKSQSAEASTLNFINEKRNEIFNEIIEIKKAEIEGSLKDIEELDKRLHEIEDIKTKVEERNGLKSLRELSDAFKSFGY